MENILTKENYDFLKNKMPILTKKEFQNMEKVVIELYRTEINAIQRLVERGFSEDFKSINEREWFLFISKIAPKLQKMKNLKLGKDKLQVLVGLSLFIIIHLLPIGPIEKEILAGIILEFVPLITELLIESSKFLYKNGKNIIKRIFSCICK
jgi:hypothetical protein